MDTKNEVMHDIKTLIDKYKAMFDECTNDDDKSYLIDAAENLEWVAKELRDWSVRVALIREDEEVKRLKPLAERH